MPDTVRSLLADAAAVLGSASPAPRLDAELLLAHALGRERGHLHAHPEAKPSAAALADFHQLLDRRRSGEPIAYLTSKREFWSLELKVTPATLIPRHETELLVELALRRIPVDADWRLLDLGTGSGAIALALARERAHCQVSATDSSTGALAVAAENAGMLGIPNVEFLAGDWFLPFTDQRFQLIVSNPPYVRENDPHLQDGDLRFEPRSALTSGIDGLKDLRRIVSAAPAHLEVGGWLLLEHGHDQGAEVRALVSARGYGQVATFRDLQGQERVTGGIRTEATPSR
ncbi:MAG TPA: peptide chain release factor N(5)-glutamine methyltransferase [Gammaproteobacteria bacterium]|nr:peptide chain release factor N(5)-glutamine methyltransferase [Gammaproteobacteria bacterium]